MIIPNQDIEDLSTDYDVRLDSLRESYDRSDTTYASGSGRTVYPSRFVIGISSRISHGLTLDAAFTHYLDNDYLESTLPQLSLGLEYAPTPVFPVYAGIGVGGLDGFSWGTGFALNLGAIQWNLGFGQQGGMFNAARGVSLSTELRLLF
jgi:hypothetical protein